MAIIQSRHAQGNPDRPVRYDDLSSTGAGKALNQAREDYDTQKQHSAAEKDFAEGKIPTQKPDMLGKLMSNLTGSKKYLNRLQQLHNNRATVKLNELVTEESAARSVWARTGKPEDKKAAEAAKDKRVEWYNGLKSNQSQTAKALEEQYLKSEVLSNNSSIKEKIRRQTVEEAALFSRAGTTLLSNFDSSMASGNEQAATEAFIQYINLTAPDTQTAAAHHANVLKLFPQITGQLEASLFEDGNTAVERYTDNGLSTEAATQRVLDDIDKDPNLEALYKAMYGKDWKSKLDSDNGGQGRRNRFVRSSADDAFADFQLNTDNYEQSIGLIPARQNAEAQNNVIAGLELALTLDPNNPKLLANLAKAREIGTRLQLHARQLREQADNYTDAQLKIFSARVAGLESHMTPGNGFNKAQKNEVLGLIAGNMEKLNTSGSEWDVTPISKGGQTSGNKIYTDELAGSLVSENWDDAGGQILDFPALQTDAAQQAASDYAQEYATAQESGDKDAILAVQEKIKARENRLILTRANKAASNLALQAARTEDLSPGQRRQLFRLAGSLGSGEGQINVLNTPQFWEKAINNSSFGEAQQLAATAGPDAYNAFANAAIKWRDNHISTGQAIAAPININISDGLSLGPTNDGGHAMTGLAPKWQRLYFGENGDPSNYLAARKATRAHLIKELDFDDSDDDFELVVDLAVNVAHNKSDGAIDSTAIASEAVEHLKEYGYLQEIGGGILSDGNFIFVAMPTTLERRGIFDGIGTGAYLEPPKTQSDKFADKLTGGDLPGVKMVSFATSEDGTPAMSQMTGNIDRNTFELGSHKLAAIAGHSDTKFNYYQVVGPEGRPTVVPSDLARTYYIAIPKNEE